MSDDPIRALLNDLDAIGKPSLPWVLRWTRGDSDPVANAWAVSEDGVAMHALLWRRYANELVTGKGIPCANDEDASEVWALYWEVDRHVKIMAAKGYEAIGHATAAATVHDEELFAKAAACVGEAAKRYKALATTCETFRKATPPTLDELLATHGAGRR